MGSRISVDDIFRGAADLNEIVSIETSEHPVNDQGMYGVTVYFKTKGYSCRQIFAGKERADRKRDELIKIWKGGKNMFSEIKETASKFLQENRMLIAWIAVLFLADHFFFGGQFRQRLQSIVEKIIGSVERKVEAIK